MPHLECNAMCTDYSPTYCMILDYNNNMPIISRLECDKIMRIFADVYYFQVQLTYSNNLYKILVVDMMCNIVQTQYITLGFQYYNTYIYYTTIYSQRITMHDRNYVLSVKYQKYAIIAIIIRDRTTLCSSRKYATSHITHYLHMTFCYT